MNRISIWCLIVTSLGMASQAMPASLFPDAGDCMFDCIDVPETPDSDLDLFGTTGSFFKVDDQYWGDLPTPSEPSQHPEHLIPLQAPEEDSPDTSSER